SAYDFKLYDAKYRFNWDSPIAFAPWDAHTAWIGANVVFQTTDRGQHWTPISPDLTLNIKAHQQPSGGPLALDVSSAEFSDTILDIEGSKLTKGEIWVGTDDGVVQLTRDGGAHWSNVSPSGIPPYGRIETVAPSQLVAGTAYANVDLHRSGDDKPYLFVTHDYGKSWSSIASGLPSDQYVRTVRPDIHNSNLIYAGTEQGIWLSYDDGAHWQKFQLNLPTVSVRDIRFQNAFDDIAISTHGRALWIMDDVSALQQLPQAQSAGMMLFKPRTAYEYSTHSNDEGAYTRFAGENPPEGAILNFYQSTVQKSAPTIEILDASGHVVRSISGTHKVAGKDRPNVTNYVGLNRVVWDFRENGPAQWLGAAKVEYRGPKTGAEVVPGTYSARIVLGGKTLTQPFEVESDPRLAYTQTDYETAYAFGKRYIGEFNTVDTALNNLDAIRKSLRASMPALRKAGKAPLVERETTALKTADDVFSTLTADYHNDEDSIQRPGGLREDMQGLLRGGGQPPTQASIDYGKAIDTRYTDVVARYNSFITQTLLPLNAELKAAGSAPINGAKTV
ncbi:MAG: hypothetical protein M3Y21_07315, partial [Candidatus Eremiobacteraeota bacterium]|nr:hypothetical protein [Candidatus Eremiobacteraeota bacterium]